MNRDDTIAGHRDDDGRAASILSGLSPIVVGIVEFAYAGKHITNEGPLWFSAAKLIKFIQIHKDGGKLIAQ